MNNNLTKFQAILKKETLDGFLVTNPTNIYYLSGFRGMSQTEREAFLVFSAKPTLIAPRLYQQEAQKLKSKILNIKIARERNELLETIAKLLFGKKKVGFEQDDLKYGEYLQLSSLNLVPFENLIENIRKVKTEDELKKIAKAQIISQKAFENIIKTLKVGQTEQEIADRLAGIIKTLGGQGLAFESIIASGPNSGRPHHVTGKRKLATGDILLLDLGAKYQNYHADLSRTVFIGGTKDDQKNIFHHVLKAQKKAIQNIGADTNSAHAFNFANDYFKNLKLDKFFTHGLGHGIGLELHENPYLRSKTDESLAEGMVFSVEPGLYFPWGGVRIEDLVIIKGGKAKVIGEVQKELIIV